MTSKTKGRIYNGISWFCILMCLFLIGRVASEELMDDARREIHMPPMRTDKNSDDESEDNASDRITESELAEKISFYIPEGFPIKNIGAAIESDGTITFTAQASRRGLIDYIKSVEGENGSGALVLRLMPETIDIEAAFMCDTDGESGLIAAYPVSFSAGKTEIEPSRLPQELFRGLSDGINKLILSSGITFTRIDFEDGAFKLS